MIALVCLASFAVGVILGLSAGPDDADREKRADTAPIPAARPRLARDETAFIGDPDFIALARGHAQT